MKTFEGLLDANGKPAEITVDLKGGEETLKEFTKDENFGDDRISRCFVLTALNDIISVDVSAGANTADVYDLFVDGILRASITSKTFTKPFHGTINKVCYKGKAGTKQSGAKYSSMQVIDRDTSMDGEFSKDGETSSVSSLVIKAWRKKTAAGAAEEGTSASEVYSYKEYNSWKELKQQISKDGPPTPFEVNFIDSTKLSKKQRDKMDEIHSRKAEDYSLIATLIFSLQSTTTLSTLGFENVPIYSPTPPPVKPPRAKKESKAKKAQAEVDEEEDAEDDATSVMDAMDEPKSEPKEQKEQAAKTKSSTTQRAEQKKQQSAKAKSSEAKQSKPNKQKAPTFDPQSTSNEVLSTLLHRKPIVESKKEVARSLSFRRTELSSADFTPVMSSSVSQNEKMREESAAAPSVDSDNRKGLALSSKNDVASVEKKQGQEKIMATSNTEINKKKGVVLHGEVGAPAHRAFLATASTQEPESQTMSSNATENSQTSNKTSTTPQSFPQVVNEASSQNIEDVMEGAQAQPTRSIIESPDFEPLTPPASAKKPTLPQLPPGDMEDLLAQRFISTAPLQLVQESQATKMSPANPLSQATTASTQGNDRETLVDYDKMVHNLEVLLQDSGIVRPSSPVFSEATEVADPMEIMESVKNSQRSEQEFHQQFKSRQADRAYQEDENSGYHAMASPILGTVKNSADDITMLDLKNDGVREEVRERQQHVSAIPTLIGSVSFPQTEKRKISLMTSCENAEERQPRKVQKTGSLEERMLAAKAKLVAAEERNRRLERERQAALEVKKKSDEVEAMFRKAEEVEQANLALEQEIQVLRGAREF